MRIDLSAIDDEPVDFQEELTIPAERLDDPAISGPMKVSLEGVVRPLGGCYRIDGRISADGTLACSRCLEPVAWQLSDTFDVEYRRAHPLDAEVELTDDDLDVVFLDGDVLDLDEVAAEQLLLALPMRIVCDDRCAGLCPRCGANRNREGECSCPDEVDPRWEALREIKGTETAN